MRVLALIGVMVLTTAFYVRFLTALFLESKSRRLRPLRLRRQHRKLPGKLIEMKPPLQRGASGERLGSSYLSSRQSTVERIANLPKSS